MKCNSRSVFTQWDHSSVGRTSWYLAIVAASMLTGSFVQSASAQSTLLAGYDFQTTTNGGTAAATAPNAPSVYLANFGTQAGTAGLYLDGTHGSSTFVTATTGNEVTAFAGTGTVNTGPGFSTSTAGASALAILGGASGTAVNGKSMVFAFSTTGYGALTLTYATQRTSTGPTGNQFSYSTDGTNFTSFSTPVVPAAAYATVTEDFSSITALNNASTVYIEYTFEGASSASGNNRLDNIQFNASPVPEPATYLGGILLVGVLGWNQRRRLGGLAGLLRNARAA